MAEHASPEEKLLKLIRRKEKPAPSPKDTAALPRVRASAGKGSPFRVFDKILMMGIIFLSGYIGYEFLFISKDIKAVIKDIEQSPAQAPEREIFVADPKPYSYYADVIRARDIFESPLYGNNVKKKEEIKTVSSIPELTQNLKLVGIVLDGNSQAIVEDVQAQQTFFLHKGEQIKNATVESIEEGKVTLLYGGQRVELMP